MTDINMKHSVNNLRKKHQLNYFKHEETRKGVKA